MTEIKMAYKKDKDGFYIIAENVGVTLSGNLEFNKNNLLEALSTTKARVKGVAIKEGLSKNNIYYTSEELHKAVPTFREKPILKNHSNDTDNMVGRLEDATSISYGKQINYSGWVSDKKTIEAIKEGLIKEVSIGARCQKLVKIKEDDDISYARGIEILELSLVAMPGVSGTSVQIANESYNNRDELIKTYLKLTNSLGVQALNTSKLSIDTIKKLNEFLLLNLNTKKEKEIKKVETKTRIVTEQNNDAVERFNGYIIEPSNLGGYAFYKK